MTTQAKTTTAKKTTQSETPKPDLQPLREIWTPATVQRTIHNAAVDIAGAVIAVTLVKQTMSFTNGTIRMVIQEALYRRAWKK